MVSFSERSFLRLRYSSVVKCMHVQTFKPQPQGYLEVSMVEKSAGGVEELVEVACCQQGNHCV